MDVLERLPQSNDHAAWYALRSEVRTPLRRYVVSTEGSRAICNRPEIAGVEYSLRMHDAMAACLSNAPFRQLVDDAGEERTCVLHFLRGGLNFELRRALHSALGLNRHRSAFMSSQRACVDGEWLVTEDTYRKLDIPDGAVILVGDVVATGTTLWNGFEAVGRHMAAQRGTVQALVLFTIGGPRAETVLTAVHRRFSERFEGYLGTVLVYLEAQFRMVDETTPLTIGLPGTDLVRLGAVLAPELELSLYDAPAHALERCAIYDAGSRAFDVPHYAEDLLDYWGQVAELARSGWTLEETIRERWPATEYADPETFRACKRRMWPGVDEALLDALWAAHSRRWAGALCAPPESADALAEVCTERLATFRAMRGSENRKGDR